MYKQLFGLAANKRRLLKHLLKQSQYRCLEKGTKIVKYEK